MAICFHFRLNWSVKTRFDRHTRSQPLVSRHNIDFLKLLQLARLQRISLQEFPCNGHGSSPQHEPATASASCAGQLESTPSQSVDTGKNPPGPSSVNVSFKSGIECSAPRGSIQLFMEWTGSGSTIVSENDTAAATAASDSVLNLLGNTNLQALMDADETEVYGAGQRIKTLGLRCVLTRSAELIRKEVEGHSKDLEYEDCISCYDLRMPQFYSKLCSFFLIPLFSTETGSFELLSKLRASLQSRQGGSSMLDDECHRLLAQSLSSPIPPALLLRVALVRLQSAIPDAHPDSSVRITCIGTRKQKN